MIWSIIFYKYLYSYYLNNIGIGAYLQLKNKWRVVIMKKRFVLIMILALLMFLVSCKEKKNISVNIHEEVIDIPGIDNEYNIFFLSDSC